MCVVVWSGRGQGEQNADVTTPTFYECALPGLIRDWRSGFGDPDLWFGVVQLAPWIGNGVDIPVEREAQMSALTVANTAIATAIDLGDPTAPFGSVHPRDKQPLGARLAACALAQVYGKAVPFLSPVFLNATAAAAPANGTVAVTVTFEPATVADGLVLITPPECPTALGVPQDLCSGFELQLLSGEWVNATASLAPGNTVLLIAAGTQANDAPVATRYAFNAWPIASLYSSAGFPALPWNATVW